MSDTDSGDGQELIPYPPSEWLIFAEERLATYVIAEPDVELQGELLLSVDRSGTVGGAYRFVLAGTHNLDVVLPATAVMQCGGAPKFKLNWQIRPSTIQLRPNSLTSVWHDFLER
jgi:hypothetical protein